MTWHGVDSINVAQIAKQELIIQLLWKCDWLIRRGLMDRCCGDLWPPTPEVNRRYVTHLASHTGLVNQSV
jgi:hypothetical protein